MWFSPQSYNKKCTYREMLENIEKRVIYVWVAFLVFGALVAGAWTERKKIFHGGSFLKLADDNMDIQNPEAQNRELSGF